MCNAKTIRRGLAIGLGGLSFAVLLALAGCKKKGSSGPVYAGSIALTRVGSADYSPFTVTYSIAADGLPASGLTVTVSANGAGATVSAVTDNLDGSYTATVTPVISGEVVVTASVGEWGRTDTVTALALKKVAAGWGQPMAVAGMVNTTGWEDSINITPDGEWLFMTCSPVSISGIIHGDQYHPWASQTSGPFAGPLRPDFPRNRITDAGAVTYSYPLFGVTSSIGPWPPPTAMYGFHRQPDGSFSEPFLVNPDDSGNGCLGAFGPCIVPQSEPLQPLLVYAFNDPRTVRVGDQTDIVVLPLQLGQPNVLGHFVAEISSGAIISPDYTGVTLGIDTAGHQGNPCAYADNTGTVTMVWTDDETVTERDVFVQTVSGGGSFPSGPWNARITPPPPVNLPGIEEIQPFFDGSQLLLRRGDTIIAIAYLGGGLDQATSWGATTVLIEGEAVFTPGRIATVGEPSLATIGGRTELYFAYVTVGAYDAVAGAYKLDINVGVVTKP